VVPRGAAGKDVHRAQAHPEEFRDDVVNLARNRQPGQHLKQIAADFGISESCLTNWMKIADVEDGVKPGTTGGRERGPA
jgi:transposase-like protein